MPISPLTKKRMEEIWRLKHEENMSYSQIAEKLNMSKSNVQRLMNLKKEELKKKAGENKPQQQEQQNNNINSNNNNININNNHNNNNIQQDIQLERQPTIQPTPNNIITTPPITQTNDIDENIIDLLPQQQTKLTKTTLEEVINELNNNYTPVVIKSPISEEEAKESEQNTIIEKINNHKYLIISVFIIVLVVGIAIWYITKKNKNEKEIPYTAPTQQIESTLDKEIKEVSKNGFSWKDKSYTPLG